MAYSRWNKYCVWYTFWTSFSSSSTEYKLPTDKLKNSQCFEICDFPSYVVSYGELKEKGLKKVVKEIQEFYQGKKETKFSDYTELRWYLIIFMLDVEEHFRWDNFFKYEWYYPTRNKIIQKWRELKQLLK